MTLRNVDKDVIHEWMSTHEDFASMDESMKELISCRNVLYELANDLFVANGDFDAEKFLETVSSGKTVEGYKMLKQYLEKKYEDALEEGRSE